MNNVFAVMSDEKRVVYDETYIKFLYESYLMKEENVEIDLEKWVELKSELQNKEVLIIAPGKSADIEKDKIVKYASREDVITIEINFKYRYFQTDYLFLSNLRRYRDIGQVDIAKAIVTSNIPETGAYLKISYSKLLNGVEGVTNNAGMMLIKLLIMLGVKNIIIVGMDGYDNEQEKNYIEKNLFLNEKRENLSHMNDGMAMVLREYKKKTNIIFLTESRFEK